jgi:hypothetical protein
MLFGWGSAVYWVIAVQTSSDQNASLPILPVVGLALIGVVGFYAMLAPLLHWWPWRERRQKLRESGQRFSVQEIQRAQETVAGLSDVIEDAPLVSAHCPSDQENFSEPEPDVITRVDHWRTKSDAAVKSWPEYRENLERVSDRFPPWHAVNIGERVAVLTAIRTALRQRYGL